MTTAGDPSAEESWCDERTAEVAACIARLAPEHGRIGERPAWFAMPYAGLWAVASAHRPEWIGWWVIAGDLPTDVLAAHDLATPRDAMRAFGKRWVLHGEQLDRGDVPPAWSHLADDGLPKLAATLKRRGAALQVWADDTAAWPADDIDDAED